ncbi:Protein FAM210A [Eumeta japonica]|uniref:Protein FAM210A n=1 Tax=Eumeta variegata TaxID=151549 RepID=A0A4C1XIQ3_EUMVA|nr:Protein FAM210A [Eumeta japonica]
MPKRFEWSTLNSNTLKVLSSQPFTVNYKTYTFKLPEKKCMGVTITSLRSYSNTSVDGKASETPPPKKPSLIQKFKQMYRDYWYVLIPVHLATSAVWCGIFYYAVRSGVDIVGILEKLRVSESLIGTMRDSKAGYFALTYALYKIATPLRYAVTLGGTTYAIRKLTTIGWIKPVPSTERLKEIIQEKKDNIQDRITESREHYKTQVQEKKAQVMEEMNRYKNEIRKPRGINFFKDKVKKM